MPFDNQRIRSAKLTNTRIDYQHRNPPRFLTSSSRMKMGQPPLSMYCRSSTAPISAPSIFTSTSHMEHSRKPLTGPLASTKHPLAAPHWKTHTMTDLNRKRSYGKLAAYQVMAPPVSTFHRDYRLFDSSGLDSSYFGQGKPFPDVPTTSSAYSHMPAHKAPSITSCYPRLLRRSLPVPHGAYTSVYRNSFTTLAASAPCHTTCMPSI